jgi:hypothetical protein
MAELKTKNYIIYPDQIHEKRTILNNLNTRSLSLVLDIDPGNLIVHT